mmetsp:Transcript_37810/g.93987  ORF Transcript_37810/g.93987 Transcript_37810/m.93987 type:complete len:241 (-) Transcript_37810:509-1231(-)
MSRWSSWRSGTAACASRSDTPALLPSSRRSSRGGACCCSSCSTRCSRSRRTASSRRSPASSACPRSTLPRCTPPRAPPLRPTCTSARSATGACGSTRKPRGNRTRTSALAVASSSRWAASRTTRPRKAPSRRRMGRVSRTRRMLQSHRAGVPLALARPRAPPSHRTACRRAARRSLPRPPPPLTSASLPPRRQSTSTRRGGHSPRRHPSTPRCPTAPRLTARSRPPPPSLAGWCARRRTR